MRAPLLCLIVLALAPFACSAREPDQPSDGGTPSALGTGSRIRDLTRPLLGDPTDNIAPNPGHPTQNSSVYVTGASFLVKDVFDETMDGKSLGAIYVQDTGSQAPFSGIQLYETTYEPANIQFATGDVIDLTGAYQDYAYSGFPAGQSYPELDKPIATFRFEYTAPAPVKIDINDLQVNTQAQFDKGYQWLGMLVEVDNVSLVAALADDGKGRVSGPLITAGGSNAPTIANQLYDLQTTAYPVGQKFTKIIGIVTYFFNFQISPRSPADIVTE